MKCEYGCGNEGLYIQTNGKLCCSKFYTQCESIKEKNKKGNIGRKHSNDTKEKMRKTKIGILNPNYGKFGNNNSFYGHTHTDKNKRKMAINKHTIKKIKQQYPLFSKIEEMRYNPDNPDEKEIQVHCKNHNCPNSKEQGGWFVPTRIQLSERLRQLETVNGNGGCYFYCCEECKQQCPLYRLRSDPFNKKEQTYTQQEYQTFRKFVLERDKYKCQYCGEQAEHVHHERPQKLEPFFTLDPDLAWSVCKKCHYKYGHKDECSTGNLAKITCFNSRS